MRVFVHVQSETVCNRSADSIRVLILSRSSIPENSRVFKKMGRFSGGEYRFSRVFQKNLTCSKGEYGIHLEIMPTIRQGTLIILGCSQKIRVFPDGEYGKNILKKFN